MYYDGFCFSYCDYLSLRTVCGFSSCLSTGGGLELFRLDFVDEETPHLDDKDFGLFVEDHLDVLEDGLGGRAGQHLGADKVRQRRLRLGSSPAPRRLQLRLGSGTLTSFELVK